LKKVIQRKWAKEQSARALAALSQSQRGDESKKRDGKVDVVWK
jgi:hypothetical protein